MAMQTGFFSEGARLNLVNSRLKNFLETPRNQKQNRLEQVLGYFSQRRKIKYAPNGKNAQLKDLNQMLKIPEANPAESLNSANFIYFELMNTIF